MRLGSSDTCSEQKARELQGECQCLFADWEALTNDSVMSHISQFVHLRHFTPAAAAADGPFSHKQRTCSKCSHRVTQLPVELKPVTDNQHSVEVCSQRVPPAHQCRDKAGDGEGLPAAG